MQHAARSMHDVNPASTPRVIGQGYINIDTTAFFDQSRNSALPVQEIPCGEKGLETGCTIQTICPDWSKVCHVDRVRARLDLMPLARAMGGGTIYRMARTAILGCAEWRLKERHVVKNTTSAHL